MNKAKQAWNSYLELGANTRLVIRIILTLFFTLVFTAVYLYNASYLQNHYEMIILADELIEYAQGLTGTGFLCVILTGLTESRTQH